LAGCSEDVTPKEEQVFPELTVDQRKLLLAEARQIIVDDPFAALVTVDQHGQPRARTVNVRLPSWDLVIWIATKPNTRKVEQIKNNPNVTLYFNNDLNDSYLSIMGTATLHDDLETINATRWFPDNQLVFLWPEFPKDYLLIKVTPKWFEVLNKRVEADAVTWRPQAVSMEQE
jgi:general stress protein 26